VKQGRWRRIADLLDEAAAGRKVGPAVAEEVAGLLDVDGVSLAMVVAGQPVAVVGTSDLAVELYDRQAVLGEGPSMDAVRTGAPQLVESLGGSDALRRMPALSQEPVLADVGALFAFPLRIGGASLGVLTAHRRSPGPLGADGYSDALSVSALVTIAMLHEVGTESDPSGPGPGYTPLDPAGVLDDVVQIAAGMVAEQLAITVVDALVRIRAHAYATGQGLVAVARSIVRRETRLQP
jgi:hypothetical protein